MREYFAVVFEDPLGGLVVNFPDFPECVTFAHSFEAASAAAAEALADYIEEVERAGEAIPEPSTYEAIRIDGQNMGCDVIRVKAIRPVK
jgi:predicted RNase H-like HicB family nuclease